MSLGSLIVSGPMLLAIPVAAAAGAVTFLSPCVLPLVPGYLSYLAGMSGSSVAAPAPDLPAVTTSEPEPMGKMAPVAVVADGGDGVVPVDTIVARAPVTPVRRAPARGRAVAGTALFVLGFSALYATYGVAFGSLGSLFLVHQRGLSQILGALLIVFGLLFAGALDRFSFAGRIVRPSVRPRAGLAGAPVLGILFGLGWTPCVGPTLAAVLALSATTGAATRGAILAFVYALGIGIPFLVVAFAFDRAIRFFGHARRHARAIAAAGGVLLIAVGVLEVTGLWAGAMIWLKVHWLSGYNAPF